MLVTPNLEGKKCAQRELVRPESSPVPYLTQSSNLIPRIICVNSLVLEEDERKGKILI